MPPVHPAVSPIPFRAPLSLAALVVLACVGFTIAFTPLRTSQDEWWHLKTGKYIDEQGLPENEIFTYTAEDYPWHNHEWLAQIGLWRIYRQGESSDLGGIRAVILFKTLFFIGTLFGIAIFLGTSTGQPAIGALSAVMLAALSRRTIYPRPPFITYGLLALTLCLFLAWRDKRMRSRWLLVLPPMFALWTNLHGGWLAGLVMGGAFWLETAVNAVLAKWRAEDFREPRNRFLQATAIGIACGLGTLANPYGYHLYELSGRVLNDTRLMDIINEMQPPNWRFVWSLDVTLMALLFVAVRPRSFRGFSLTTLGAALLFFIFQIRAWLLSEPGMLLVQPAAWETTLRAGLAYMLIVVAGARSKQNVGLALTLLCLFFAQQAIHHVRHLPLFGLVLAPFLAFSLADWVRGSVRHWDEMWQRGRPFKTSEELQDALLPPRWCLLHRSGFTISVMALAFYWALPEEAVSLAMKQGTFGERLMSRSLLDRNLFLLRGQDPSLGGVNERGTELGAYPKAAVDFLAQSRLPGRLWNGGNYGGYLIWRLSPERYKVFTDNRYDIWGGDFIQDQEIVLQAFKGDADAEIPSWEEVLDYWEVNTLILPVEATLHGLLATRLEKPAANWQRVWAEDGQFAIWTRTHALVRSAE